MKKRKEGVFKDPSSLRIANQLEVIEEIRKRPISCTELSSILNLSNVALKNITDELVAENIIFPVANNYQTQEAKERGRKRVLYALNDEIGVFAVIDFSGRDIVVVISDMSNRIIARDIVPNVLYIDANTLKEAAEKIRGLLSKRKLEDKQLLGIALSSPGKFDKNTYDFINAPRIKNFRHLNFKKFFENEFGVRVDMYNDINMGLRGEIVFGSIPKTAENVFFAYIDITAGSALMLNGEYYLGSNGFAGELPNLNELDEYSTLWGGKFFTITDIFKEIQDISKSSKDSFYSQNEYRLDEIIERYQSNDPIVLSAVDKSAKINAIELLTMANMLDLDCICIEGRILDFGKAYYDSLLKYFRLYDANFNTVNIITSSLNHDANILGAVDQASKNYLLSRFVEIAKKRKTSATYVTESALNSFI